MKRTLALWTVFALSFLTGTVTVVCWHFLSRPPLLHDCSGDDFTWSGNVKYKFVEDSLEDEYYTFPKAVEACHALDSVLWDVQGGEEEWLRLVAMAQAENKQSMWINGKPVGQCLGTCLEEDALSGRGVAMAGMNYSRLVNGASEDGMDCVYVDKHLYWKTGSCITTSAWGLCVKRDCQREVI